MIDLEILEKEILEAVKSVDNYDELEAIRVSELGKKGRISLLMKDLSLLSTEEKKRNRINSKQAQKYYFKLYF